MRVGALVEFGALGAAVSATAVVGGSATGLMVIPHFGQRPGLREVTAGCMGQLYVVAALRAFARDCAQVIGELVASMPTPIKTAQIIETLNLINSPPRSLTT